MITWAQITNTEIFSFITVLVFKLLNSKVLFMRRKDNRNCQKVGYLFEIIANVTGEILQNYK